MINFPKIVPDKKSSNKNTEQAYANSLDEKQGLASNPKIFGASVINAVKREVCDYSEDDHDHGE